MKQIEVFISEGDADRCLGTLEFDELRGKEVSSFELDGDFVLHPSVSFLGPVFRDGQHGEPEKLAACYRNSLALAAENGCKSIAFPCISTGIYGYPIEDAAKIAVREVRDYLTQSCREAEDAEGKSGRAVAPRPPMEVVFCCFSARDAAAYEQLLS